MDSLVVYLSERRRPRAVAEMIYGVHAQQSLKPVNARRLHKRAGPVVLPLVRGPGVISVEVQLFETGSHH